MNQLNILKPVLLTMTVTGREDRFPSFKVEARAEIIQTNDLATCRVELWFGNAQWKTFLGQLSGMHEGNSSAELESMSENFFLGLKADGHELTFTLKFHRYGPEQDMLRLDFVRPIDRETLHYLVEQFSAFCTPANLPEGLEDYGYILDHIDEYALIGRENDDFYGVYHIRSGSDVLIDEVTPDVYDKLFAAMKALGVKVVNSAHSLPPPTDPPAQWRWDPETKTIVKQ